MDSNQHLIDCLEHLALSQLSAHINDLLGIGLKYIPAYLKYLTVTRCHRYKFSLFGTGYATAYRCV